MSPTNQQQKKWHSILVVDDDEIVIQTIRPVLISNGFSVLYANTGEDGLRIAREQKPDLIVLDVIMPGIKGRDVCKKLKADNATKNIPVVFMTAKDSEDDVQLELEIGAVAHLTKPVNNQTLVATLNSILGVK